MKYDAQRLCGITCATQHTSNFCALMQRLHHFTKFLISLFRLHICPVLAISLAFFLYPKCGPHVNGIIKWQNVYPAQSDSGGRSQMKTGSSHSRSVGGRGTATGWRPSFVCEEWARSEWAPWSQSPARCLHHPHWWPATRKRTFHLKKKKKNECDGTGCFNITQVVHLVLWNWELRNPKP